ncbi:hypothetical protein J6590_019371 [Homalodisca vitripennis]|nr:hypothetical protein J6590_019371 [Homalodisca vitripennis]
MLANGTYQALASVIPTHFKQGSTTLNGSSRLIGRTNKKPAVVASHSLPAQPPRPTPVATAAPIVHKRPSTNQVVTPTPPPVVTNNTTETTGTIIDVKPELVEAPMAPSEAVEIVKKESIDPNLSTLPSVFDPLPESPKDEKAILPLQALSHPTDG